MILKHDNSRMKAKICAFRKITLYQICVVLKILDNYDSEQIYNIYYKKSIKKQVQKMNQQSNGKLYREISPS